jgi:hypothetical protein
MRRRTTLAVMVAIVAIGTALTWGLTRSPAQQPMDALRWEYLLSGRLSAYEWNRYGSEGWEFAGVLAGNVGGSDTLIFKRRR